MLNTIHLYCKDFDRFLDPFIEDETRHKIWSVFKLIRAVKILNKVYIKFSTILQTTKAALKREEQIIKILEQKFKELMD